MKLIKHIPVLSIVIIGVLFCVMLSGCGPNGSENNSLAGKSLSKTEQSGTPTIHSGQTNETMQSSDGKKTSIFWILILGVLFVVLLLFVVAWVIINSQNPSKCASIQPKTIRQKSSFPNVSESAQTGAMRIETAEETLRKIRADIISDLGKKIESFVPKFNNEINKSLRAESDKLDNLFQEFLNIKNSNKEIVKLCTENFHKCIDLFGQINNSNSEIGKLNSKIEKLNSEKADLEEAICNKENPYESIIPASVISLFGLSSDKLKDVSPAIRIAIREWCCFIDWMESSPKQTEFKTEFRKIDKAIAALRQEPGFDMDAMRLSLKKCIEDVLPSKFNTGVEVSWDFKGKEFSPDKNYSSDGGARVVSVISAYYNIKGVGGEKAEVQCE